MSGPLRRLLGGIARADRRVRLAERVAQHLRQALPLDHIVLSPYEPRDRREHVPVVIVGREAVFVVEPRDDDGDLVCYQDHWYRRRSSGSTHVIADPPSLRARSNAARVRSDLATGGFINVPIEPVVLLTRGRPLDVGSSCVPVVAGVDALVRYALRNIADELAPDRTQALAGALATNIRLSIA